MLGHAMVTINVSTGLYIVTRRLTIFNAADGDSGNFECSASADIPKIGVKSVNVSFSLLIYRKCNDANNMAVK